MSNISGLLGTAGGFKGTGVDAPSNWVDNGKLDQANVNLQGNFANQKDLLAQLQAQNGLSNQTSVYNQLQGVANGTGPNPAQAQLAQATSANTANQAALMAGQRGSSQNTGLIARQASMQGGANQQQSAGQAATMQANQSLGALAQMGGMANTMAANQVGQTNTNEQAAQANLNGLMTGSANQNAIKGSLIQATAQQQASGLGSGMSGAGAAMSSGSGSGGARGGKVENMPKLKMAGGGGLGLITKFATMFADGGPIQDASAYQGASKFGAFLNGVQQVEAPPVQTWGNAALQKGAAQGMQSAFNKPGQKANKGVLGGSDAGAANEQGMEPPNSGDNQPGANDTAPDTGDTVDTGDDGGDSGGDDGGGGGGDSGGARGGKVEKMPKIPVLLSPGEKKLTPEQAKAAAAGKIDPMKAGKTVAPGVKPKVGGAKNDYANDVVKSEEEPGTLILPRSVTQSKNPHWAAMRFVHAHMMANGGRVGIAAKSKPKGKKK